MNQKTLIIVVIILVVVFVCGVGVGTFGQCNPDDAGCTFDTSPPDWISSLGGIFGGILPLRSADIQVQTFGCVFDPEGRTVSVGNGASCTLNIATSWLPVRKVMLGLTAGNLTTLSLDPLKANALTEDYTLLGFSDCNPNNGNAGNVNLTIQREGATLILNCNIGPCTVCLR